VVKLHELAELGQSIWYANIRRVLLDSGELEALIEAGVTGVTSNPSIFEKAIAGSANYDSAMGELVTEGKSEAGIFEALALEDIRDGGGFGSIIGRNTFEREKAGAMQMLDKMIRIHLGEND
jgi:transaldolase